MHTLKHASPPPPLLTFAVNEAWMRGSCKRGWVGIDADRKRREDRETAGGWVAEEGRGRGGGGGGEKERGEVQILPNRHSHHLLVRGSVHVCRSCYAVLPSLPPSFLLSLLSLSLSLYIYVCSIPFSLILLPPSCIQGRSQLLSSLFSHACPFVTLRACQAIPLWICVYNMCVHACVMREREREEERGRGGAGSKCWQKVHMIMCFCFSACQSVLCYPVCVYVCVQFIYSKACS